MVWNIRSFCHNLLLDEFWKYRNVPPCPVYVVLVKKPSFTPARQAFHQLSRTTMLTLLFV